MSAPEKTDASGRLLHVGSLLGLVGGPGGLPGGCGDRRGRWGRWVGLGLPPPLAGDDALYLTATPAGEDGRMVVQVNSNDLSTWAGKRWVRLVET